MMKQHLDNVFLVEANADHGFTLVELLVAITVIGILAALLLPTLSRSKENADRVTCLNNQKQLNLAWQMYADQSGGKMAFNDWEYTAGIVVVSPSNSWVTGNAALDTNPATITAGSIYPWVKSMQAYRCPLDHSLVLGTTVPTLRSYSLSCYMGGPEEDIQYDVTPLSKISQIQKPSAALTFLEEDISTIDDGHFLYSTMITNWLNVPSWRHQNGDVLAFADGHLEYWKWRSARPTVTYPEGGPDLTNPAAVADITRLQQTAPAGE
jgi:prepilin-type N-terminal cleavage/methylation domain-containing protein